MTSCHDEAQTAADEGGQVKFWTEMLTMAHEDVVEVPQVWRGGGQQPDQELEIECLRRDSRRVSEGLNTLTLS